MIVCSCTGVTDRDIREAIAWMRASDPYTLITPGKIYRALGKSAECGGCIRLFVEKMRRGRRSRRAVGTAQAAAAPPARQLERGLSPVQFKTIPYCGVRPP